jgi:hypothetical protein
MSSQIVIPDNVAKIYAGRPMPRGIRNNNPGNIRLGDNWQGLCDVQQDPSFCQFSDIKFGIRCLAYLLRISYFQRQRLVTVYDIINRWAPSTENDTPAYVAAVSANMGVQSTDTIDLRNDNLLGDMIAAIIKHENGVQPYSGLQIIAGIRLLGS